MALEYYEEDMKRCNRCSYCKFVPYMTMKNDRFIGACPSIANYNLHSRSASGKMITALSVLQGRIDMNNAVRDIAYQCQMCGACDVSCKIERDLDPYEVIQELRFKCVESGIVPPEYLDTVESLKKEANTMGKPKADRGNWADGIKVKDINKEPAEVLFHAGCKYAYDESLWPTAKKALGILVESGVDVAIAGSSESCCGGRSYEMGFKDTLNLFAKRNIALWKSGGVKTVVTPCADCYQAFKVLYDKTGQETQIEFVHITEYINNLIKEGKLKLTKEVPLKVTYHDPCHLGRLAEPWIHWEGTREKVFGQLVVHNPPKEKRFGTNGVFDAPRQILKSVPGLTFIEMHRIKEYAWCCGSGAGVKKLYPDFAQATALERIEEAKSVEAQVIVSSCPRCKSNFSDAVNQSDDDIRVLDIIDIVHQAL